ncbi:hypothetical protein BSKO_13152 [Bryopsis sp. KO-2023]|nr:hypothetical protein BSKO_13152 [Bryopsis sp. KO-2023]
MMEKSSLVAFSNCSIIDLGSVLRISLVLVIFAETDDTLEELAGSLKNILSEKTLPSWLETVDSGNGGYTLGETIDGKNPEGTKTLVSQPRLLWALSWAHVHGFSEPGKDYLAAAKSGYDFIVKNFWDEEDKGYIFSTDISGAPVDEGKYLQGHTNLIFAFVEYYKASKDGGALQAALDIPGLISENAVDNVNAIGGFFEDFNKDWSLVTEPQGSGSLGTRGFKTDNGIIGLVLSLAELVKVSVDPEVKELLESVVDSASLLFYPKNPAVAVSKRTLTGEQKGEFPLTAYGHLVEFAWMKVEAEIALGRTPDWDFFDEYVRHSFEQGRDDQTGGLLEVGELAWWPQLEVMRMAATEKKHRGGGIHDDLVKDVVKFYVCELLDSDDGLAVWSVNSDGSIRNDVKSSMWKAGYHEVRGMGELNAAYS